jgi:hypothetical protein
MGAVTYPNSQVESYIRQHFIPVQFNVRDHPEAMDQFNTAWTPTLIFQDAEGRESRRSQGYLDPKRMLGELALARDKDALNRHDYAAARTLSAEALEMTKGDPDREPEALYWSAVANYKANDDANHLMQGWNRLLDQFPQSEWARRASFIRD